MLFRRNKRSPTRTRFTGRMASYLLGCEARGAQIATLALLVVLVALFAGCGRAARRASATRAERGESSAQGPVSPATPSASPRSLVPGRQEQSVTVQGLRRSYTLYIPSKYDSNRRWPVVMVFHGALGNAGIIEEVTKWDAKAEKEGLVVVYPNGTGRLGRFLVWNAGICCEPAIRNGVDDMEFIRTVLDHLSAHVRIDPNRVYATGFSNGGMISHRLGCEVADRIAAFDAGSGALGVDTRRPSRRGHAAPPAWM